MNPLCPGLELLVVLSWIISPPVHLPTLSQAIVFGNENEEKKMKVYFYLNRIFSITVQLASSETHLISSLIGFWLMSIKITDG